MSHRLLYLVRHGEQEHAEVESDEAGLSDLGRQQALLLGQRLRGIPFTALHHSPLPRAVQTGHLIADHLPGVPLHPSALVGDYIPSVPDRADLPPVYAAFVDGLSEADRTEGPRLAAQAIEHFAVPTQTAQRELIVTHNFVISWFVRHALDAPEWRWLGLNQYHCGLTVLLYRHDRPAAVVSYNDVGHLPLALRGTGFPPELRV